MIKRVVAFWVVVGFLLTLTQMFQVQKQVQLQPKPKTLNYTITSDCPSPVEIRQIIILPVSTGSVVHQDKSNSFPKNYVSYRVTLKYLNSRYPLYIKERIGSPLFLRNNCLRI